MWPYFTHIWDVLFNSMNPCCGVSDFVCLNSGTLFCTASRVLFNYLVLCCQGNVVSFRVLFLWCQWRLVLRTCFLNISDIVFNSATLFWCWQLCIVLWPCSVLWVPFTHAYIQMGYNKSMNQWIREWTNNWMKYHCYVTLSKVKLGVKKMGHNIIVETRQAYYGNPRQTYYGNLLGLLWNRPDLLWKLARLIVETGQVYYGNRPGFFMETGQTYSTQKMTLDAVRLLGGFFRRNNTRQAYYGNLPG